MTETDSNRAGPHENGLYLRALPPKKCSGSFQKRERSQFLPLLGQQKTRLGK